MPNKKNNYTQLKAKDERTEWVAIGCGNCIECRRQKANMWRTRLSEEYKKFTNVKFITLSISNESFKAICNELNITNLNAIAKLMVRRWCERWRKHYQYAPRHWLITELGKENDRLHLHGFLFENNANADQMLQDTWQYGNIYIGDYCTLKTINYCVKYCLKIDEEHKDYKAIILTSKGIGADYVDKNRIRHRYNGENTIEYYTLSNGRPIGLNMYYRNKLFTEDEREQLWINKLNQNKRYVMGIEIDVSTQKGIDEYERILDYQQKQNEHMGYGNDSNEWKKRDYNISLSQLNKKNTYFAKHKLQ